MAYRGPERRRHPRMNARFVISYRILEEDDNTDISQAKNLGLGGMLLTTNREFAPGTNLALEIKLPFDNNPIMLIGKVLESRKVVTNLIYDTRLIFMAVDEKHRGIIGKTIEHYFKRGSS